MKFCFLGATFASYNMGCSALAASAIRCALQHSPGCRIVFLNYGIENCILKKNIGDTEVTIECANMRFSKKLHLKGHVLQVFFRALLAAAIPVKKVRDKFYSGYYYTRMLAESQVVCSVAGGDSFSDIYGMQRFMSIALPMLIALLMKKTLIMMPQTYGPFKSAVSRFIAGYLVRKSTIVFSRDYEGIKDAHRLAGSKSSTRNSIRFCYDLAFILDARKPPSVSFNLIEQNPSKDVVRVGLNVSGLLYNEKCARDRIRFGLADDYRKVIETVACKLLSHPETVLSLVPHVFGDGINDQADPPACRNLYNFLNQQYPGRVFLVDGKYDQHEIKYLIGTFDFFAGSRMHACIAALSQNIPAVGIAYSKKFKGVFETVGMQDMVADLRIGNAEQISASVETAYLRRSEITMELCKRMEKVKATVFGIFKGM